MRYTLLDAALIDLLGPTQEIRASQHSALSPRGASCMDVLPGPLEPHPSRFHELMVVFAIGIIVVVIQTNLFCSHLVNAGRGCQGSATSVSFNDMLSARKQCYRDRNE